MRLLLAAATTLALLLPSARAQDTPAPVVHESEHYRLTAHPPFDDGEEYLRLAEALHPVLAEHFGAAPELKGDARLEILFWPDAEGFRTGAAADGIPADQLQSGGIYWPPTKRGYFWRQPSDYATRHLFLHELVHQFHYLAVMRNQGRTPAWYTEGLAEHFAWHRWDGTTLVTGLHDVVALEERIPAMVAAARDGSLDLRAVVRGEHGGAKPEGWAAVHALLTHPDAAVRKRFRAAERALWKGLSAKKVEAAVLGPKPDRTSEALRTHVATLEPTWKIEWIAWDAVGEALEATSATVALIRTRTADDTGRVGADLLPGTGSLGLVVGFRSTHDFVAVYRRPGGRVDLVQRHSGGWTNLASADGPGGDRIRLTAVAESDGRITVRTGDRTLLSATVDDLAVPGSVGLFVDAGRGRFENVTAGDRQSRD